MSDFTEGWAHWAKQWVSDSQRLVSKCSKPDYKGEIARTVAGRP